MRYGKSRQTFHVNTFVADRYGMLICDLSMVGYQWVSGNTYADSYGNTVTVIGVGE